MTRNDEIEELARKLDLLLERGGKEIGDEFDAEERAQLRRLIIVLGRLDSLGFFAKYAFYGLLAVGAVIANWERIIEWLRGV